MTPLRFLLAFVFLGTRIFFFQKSLKGACTSHSCLGCGKVLACENIRFSTLFAAVDVSHGGTSTTQRQKFHTDDVRHVRNPVRSPDWSKEYLHCFDYCLRMADKRQKATKIKCKRDESLTKQSIFVEYSLL